MGSNLINYFYYILNFTRILLIFFLLKGGFMSPIMNNYSYNEDAETDEDSDNENDIDDSESDNGMNIFQLIKIKKRLFLLCTISYPYVLHLYNKAQHLNVCQSVAL